MSSLKGDLNNNLADMMSDEQDEQDNHDHPPPYIPPPQGSSAHPVDGKQQPPLTFACILLSRQDRVRVLGFPAEYIPPVREAINNAWPKGIQKEAPFESGFEWKLSGRPWVGLQEQSVPARRLVLHLIRLMYTKGWHLVASCDLTKKTVDQDTLFFRNTVPVERSMFCVSFNHWDKARLIDSPNDLVREAFHHAMHHWHQGIQEETDKEPGCYQLKLKGSPWISSSDADIANSRLLVCQLLGAADALGYELVGSVNLGKPADKDYGMLDSLFFASKLV